MDHLFLVMLVTFWCTTTVSNQVGVINLFPATSDIILDLRYTINCTVTGDIRNQSIVFERNKVTICQRLVYKDGGNTYCNSSNVPLSGYDCQCDGYDTNTSRYSVIIEPFTAVDATRWLCKTINTAGVVYISNFVYLYFSHLTLSGNVKQFDTDGVNAIIFTCITSNVTERPVFTWINRTLDGDLLIENNMDIRQYNESYRQEFKFVPHWYQDKDKIACQVSNKNTNMTTTSNEEILSLKYLPQEPPIITQDDNSISPVHSEITIKEGAMLKLSCKVFGGRPLVSNITLRCGTYTNTSQTVGLLARGHLSFKVTRDFHNQTCLCSASHVTGRYNLTTKVTLKVNYAPDVIIRHVFNSSENNLTLTCEVNGRPANYSFFPFTHIRGGYRIRQLPGQHDGSNKYMLVIDDVTYADSGNYQCNVSNGIKGLNKVKVQTNVTTVHIGYKPILDTSEERNKTVSAVIGQTYRLDRKIFSNANITSHTWTNGRGDNFTGHFSQTEVTLSIYNTKVKETGYLLTLDISHLREDDLGVYRLRLCNAFGCSEFYTTLNAAVSEPVRSPISIVVPAASGAVGFVVLIIIIVVIICVIRKRRNLQTNKKTSVDVADPDLENAANEERDNPVMVENDIYFLPSSKKPKEKRELKCEDSAEQDDVGAAYSVVNKHPKSKTDDRTKSQHRGTITAESDTEEIRGGKANPEGEDLSSLYSVVNKHRDKVSRGNTSTERGSNTVELGLEKTGKGKTPSDQEYIPVYSVVNKKPKSSGRNKNTRTVVDDTSKLTDHDTLYSVVNKKKKPAADDT